MKLAGRRVLVVEDEPLTASLLSGSLSSQGFAVEIAGDVVEALAVVDRFDPDAALIDISLGDGPNGIDLAHVLREQSPWIALLFLTKHSDLRTAGLSVDDLPPGCGFMRKDRVRDALHLLQNLESVLADQQEPVRDDQDPAKLLAGLSSNQMEIMRLMAQGYTNDYIARYKGMSRSSIERWIIEIFRALKIDTRGDLNPRVEAVRHFIEASNLPNRS